jgi:hypothetical protein
MLNRDISTSDSKIVPSLKQGVGLLQGGYSAFLFSALSRDNWAEAVTTGMTQFFTFPAFVGLSMARTGLYLYDLINAKNRNVGKIARLTREMISLGVTSTAVVGGFLTSTILSTLSPFLFVGGMAFNTLYHASAAIYSGYRLAVTKDPVSQQKHRANLSRNTVGAVLGGITTIGIAFMMVAKIAPVAMAIVNAVTNAIGFGMGVVGAIKARINARKNSTVLPVSTINRPLLKNRETSDYYYENNRALGVVTKSNPQAYLLKEIDSKVIALSQALNSTKSSWRARLFTPQKNIQTKIRGLQLLRQDVQQPESEDDHPVLVSQSLFRRPQNGLFQSFFRKKSDTQDIFEAASVYFRRRG